MILFVLMINTLAFAELYIYMYIYIYDFLTNRQKLIILVILKKGKS